MKKQSQTPPELIALAEDLEVKHSTAAAALNEFKRREAERNEAIAKLKTEIADCEFQARELLNSEGSPSEIGMRRLKLLNTVPVLERRIQLREKIPAGDLDALRAPQSGFFQLYNRLAGALVRVVERRRQALLDELGVIGPAPMPPRDLLQSGSARLGVRSPDPDVQPARVDRELQQFEALDFKPCTADLSKPTPHQIESDLKAAEEKLPLLIDKIQQCGEALMLAQIDAEPATSLAPGLSLRNRGNAILAEHKALQETKSPALKPSDTPRHVRAGRFAL